MDVTAEIRSFHLAKSGLGASGRAERMSDARGGASFSRASRAARRSFEGLPRRRERFFSKRTRRYTRPRRALRAPSDGRFAPLISASNAPRSRFVSRHPRLASLRIARRPLLTSLPDRLQKRSLPQGARSHYLRLTLSKVETPMTAAAMAPRTRPPATTERRVFLREGVTAASATGVSERRRGGRGGGGGHLLELGAVSRAGGAGGREGISEGSRGERGPRRR